ncbi:MAG TPA: dihydropteroate synthase [Gemmatales bacterium]|nr:dihydropteroate synthase [Gemmatales bacterium]
MPTYSWSLAERTITIGRMPLIMGIVNATPDSFSDGGSYDPIDQALKLIDEGADILDIGGESTRPGAAVVDADEEIRRVIPVISKIISSVKMPISIDTSKARVAREALAAGATIINDISALSADPQMVEIAANSDAGIVAMHRQGTPQSMQIDPQYENVVEEVINYLKLRLFDLAQLGIAPERIALDPGIGFGKRTQHNLQLLGHLDQLLALGRPICLGVSRKGFINRTLGREGHPEVGDFGTVGIMLHALSQGWVQIARVHNVKAFQDAAKLYLAVEGAQA